MNPWTPYNCVLDVAGGNGALSLQLGRAHPHLCGIVMDLPLVCRLAEKNIAAHGLAECFIAQAADLFAGLYPAGGGLLIVESVLDDELRGSQFGVLLSLHVTVCCEPGARERSEVEHRALLTEAGFTQIEVRRFGGLRDLIVAGASARARRGRLRRASRCHARRSKIAFDKA